MLSRAMAAAVLPVLLAALYSIVGLARADWLFVKGDASSVRRALRLAPDNGEYAGALARLEPERAVDILHQAAARNPLDGGVLLELGLAQEQQGDFAGAERTLIAVARLDRGFGAQSALSDFYFHRHDAARFWPAVRSALAVSYDDASEQFRQCWALTSDAQAILDRALPVSPAVWRQYLDFLVREGRLDAAVPVAAKVLSDADRQAAPALLEYCDRMLENWRGREAKAVWDGLAARNLIERERGFDWRISLAPGMHVAVAPDGWQVDFSGTEPESTTILSRYVPLLAVQRYVLSASYQPPLPGLRYQLFVENGRDLLGGAGDRPGEVGFQVPEGATLGRLVFSYLRAPGTTRIDGRIVVREPALRTEGQ